MKTKHVIQAIIFVALLGSLGFNYMLWKTKENIKIANNKILEEHIVRSEAMQYDLFLQKEYEIELKEDIAKLELQLQLKEELIKEMNGELYGANEFGSESDNQKIIFSELGGEMEYVLSDGSRVDIVTEKPREAIEIDWANKRYEGIGQAIFYMFALNAELIIKAKEEGVLDVSKLNYYQPRVILLAKGAGSGWEKYRDQVEFCKMRCWVFDAETKTWLDRE